MTRWLLITLVLTGCSYALVERRPIEKPIECHTAYIAAPVVDGIAGVSATLGAIGGFTRNSPQRDLDRVGGIVMAVIALAYVPAAVLGFYEVSTCPAAKEAHEDWERDREELAAHIARKAANRDRAWKLTQQAQAAARAGDCTTAVRLGRDVMLLDAELYATTYERDAAIARCLKPASP